MPKGEKEIWIHTTRYAATIREFLKKYPNAVVKLNRKLERRATDEWCTKRNLAPLIDFSLSDDDRIVLMFHDDARDLCASIDQLPLVKDLAARKIVRYGIIPGTKSGPGFLGGFPDFLLKLLRKKPDRA